MPLALPLSAACLIFTIGLATFVAADRQAAPAAPQAAQAAAADDDEAVARAQSSFRGSYEVDHAGRTYHLARTSLWRRGYTVLDGGVEIGSIEPTRAWSNAAEVRLPDTMPLQLQVFIVGVVAIQWRRQQSSSATAST